MTIYKNQEQIEKDIKDGVLAIEGDVRFECNFSIGAEIVVSGNISGWNISAWDISARNISAGNISAWDISAWNISAWDISAWDISAWDILYWAFCSVYLSIKCKSIKGQREPHQEPVCLDGKLEIIKDEPEKPANKSALLEEIRQSMIDGELRESFEKWFPKDEDTSQHPSKSNRSGALALWGDITVFLNKFKEDK
jgi:hypothetical protein